MNTCRDATPVDWIEWKVSVDLQCQLFSRSFWVAADVSGVRHGRPGPRVEALGTIGMGSQFIAHVSGYLQYAIPIIGAWGIACPSMPGLLRRSPAAM